MKIHFRMILEKFEIKNKNRLFVFAIQPSVYLKQMAIMQRHFLLLVQTPQ